MKHCIHLFLLFAISLIALALLAVAFGTHWWTTTSEENIPSERSLNVSDDTRVYTTLIPISERGLLSECIKYRNATILVSSSFDFREELSHADQLKLSNETCSKYQFTCRKGAAILRPLTRCIDQGQNCDRIIDCEDKSDEASCTETFPKPSCRAGYTECLDGKTCYRKNEQTCDGVSNCHDESDEMNCNRDKCAANKHVYCPRERKCARRENSYRCDGIVDCADNSDEENCQQCHPDTKAFLCDSKCFLPEHRCNGIVDCSDFRDESNCSRHNGTSKSQGTVYHDHRLCEEKFFNPLNIYPPKHDISTLRFYPQPNQRIQYLNFIYYLQLAVFYGITSGLVFIFLSIISLFFFACCRHKCIRVPFYFYSVWALLAWIMICIALLSFVNIWIWKKENLSDYEKNSPLNIMIHQRNPSLQDLEFLGLSFWLACGAALTIFIGILLSCCICCTISSTRSENKEYEIMHMQNY